jgi:sulfur carrier protein
VRATINGRESELPDGLTVHDLLGLLGSPAGGIAVACNDRVVRRGEYETNPIREGDRIEIITAAAGG